jgi:DNA-directed RNA polymerase subunit RPC12/RpoP
MVEYKCKNCDKIFNKKSNYKSHINRKNKCDQKSQNCSNLLLNAHKNSKANIKDEKEYTCIYCNNSFVKKSNLNRHIAIHCKVKKESDEALAKEAKEKEEKEAKEAKEKEEKEAKEKEERERFNQLLELNKKLIEQQEEIRKQNDELKQQLVLRKSNKKTNIQNSHNNTNCNNTTNSNNTVNVQIVNYGSEDYSKLDNKLFLDPMIKGVGKQIFLKMIENVYINPDKPEYQNIVITDKNRQICKTYKNNRWRTTDIKIINSMLNRIIYYAKEKHEEFNKEHSDNKDIKDKLKIVKKHIDRCDPDYIADLIEEQDNNEKVNNKSKIKDCKEFYEMVYNDTINLLHDFKDIIYKPTNKN